MKIYMNNNVYRSGRGFWRKIKRIVVVRVVCSGQVSRGLIAARFAVLVSLAAVFREKRENSERPRLEASTGWTKITFTNVVSSQVVNYFQRDLERA